MPSYSSIWIPALAVAHLVGLALFLHAIQQINGALTYWGWWLKWVLIYKKKFKGDFKMAWYYTYPGAKEAFDATNAQQTPGGVGFPVTSCLIFWPMPHILLHPKSNLQIPSKT
jgi:hypothetical protein